MLKGVAITVGTVEGGVFGAVLTGGNVEGVLAGAFLGLLTSSTVRLCSKLFFNKKVGIETNNLESSNQSTFSPPIIDSPFVKAAKNGELPNKEYSGFGKKFIPPPKL